MTNAAGDPLPDITVLAYAYESSGATWTQFGWNMAFTAADGTYQIGGLATGDYHISFWDDAGVYLRRPTPTVPMSKRPPTWP